LHARARKIVMPVTGMRRHGGERHPTEIGAGAMSIGTILLIVLILIMIGVIPT
jgi:hypothetical protein